MPQQKLIERKFWDAVAAKNIYAAFREHEYAAIFNRHLPKRSRGRALDIGCAMGVSAMLLIHRGYQVTGIDISPGLIRKARKLWAKVKPRSTFKVGDAERLDFNDNSVELCFFGGVIHHFPNPKQVISEARRVLKPGGRLVMVEPNLLDVMEQITWKIAGWRGMLSPNEYPVNPLKLKRLLGKRFYNYKIYPIRTDTVPFFKLIPGFKKVLLLPFVQPTILAIINLFRSPLYKGNFFVLSCLKR